jgi:hypothetical protein
MFALSGIAAILPAAGSRLAESVAEDRAALMAANVFTDLQAAGLFDYTLFTTPVPIAKTSGTWNLTDQPDKQLRTLALGHNVVNVLDFNPSTADSEAGKIARDYFFDQFHVFPLDPSRPAPATAPFNAPLPEPWPPVLHNIWPYSQPPAPPPSGSTVPIPFSVMLPLEARRDFFIQDDVEFVADSLASKYEAGTAGPRLFKRGVCWGATLAASGTSVGPGSTAILSVAIFRKIASAQAIDLTRVSGTLFRLPADKETVRSTFLRPCSYVLAIPRVRGPSDPPGWIPPPPRWFRVQSSWTTQSLVAANRNSFVSLPAAVADYVDPVTTTRLCVIGFASLIRVDEYPVVLK